MTEMSTARSPGFKQKFIHGFRWTFVRSVGGMLVRAATLVVLSRLLTPADFGVVAIAVSMIGSTCLLVELGVGPALIQRRELTYRHVGSAICVSLVMATLLIGLLQLFTPPLVDWLGIAPQENVFRFLTLMLLLQPLATILSSIARRNLEMKHAAAADLSGAVFGYSAVGITMALLGFGYWALATAQLAQFATSLAMLLVSQRRKLSLRVGLTEARDVLAFGASFSVGRIANYAAQKFDRALIGLQLGVEAAGNYQRTINMLQVVGPFFAGPLDAVMFPLLSRIQDDASKLRRGYRATTAVAALLTMPASVLLCVSAPVLVPLVLGPQWFDVVLPTQIMAGVLFFRTNDSITDTLTRSVGRVKERAALQVGYATLSLGSICILKDFGLPGITAGLLAVTVLNFVIMSFLVRRVTSMTLADNFLPLLPAVIVAATLALAGLGFYLVLGHSFFTLGWMASYLFTSALIYGALIGILPASLFPEDLAALRGSVRQRIFAPTRIGKAAAAE